jgi:DnaK suppressor protein
MASKKLQTAAKKVMKSRTASKPKSTKKTAVRTTKKTTTTPKGIKASEKIKKTKKLALKTPRTRTTKNDVRARTASKVQPETVAVKKQGAAPKKKLSPREQRIQEIKRILIVQKNELLSEAEEALNALPGQTIFPDMGDQASAEIDRNFMLRLRGREQRLLKKIEQAIEKIDTGSFGICDVCGEEISLKRLEARPVTNMCIFCKTEQEEEEKLRGK